MFRIENRQSDPRPGKLQSLRYVWGSSKAKTGLLSFAILIAAYFTWTHGNLLPQQYKQQILEAQAKSPLPPEWLERYFGKDHCGRPSYCGQDADPDRDNLTNFEEFLFFTDPVNPDTDKDSALDGDEVRALTNPLGSGFASTPRDVNDLSEYNPLADELIQEGLQEIESGNILTFEQIKSAAAALRDLPAFSDIPFLMTSANNQEGINKYMNYITQATDDFRANSVVETLGANVVDSSDVDQVDDYLNALITYHNTLVYIEVPSDAFAFHRAFYGSLIFQALMANNQKEYLEGVITEDRSRDLSRLFTVYYTRFVQEMGREGEKLKTKYTFPFTLDTTNQNQ